MAKTSKLPPKPAVRDALRQHLSDALDRMLRAAAETRKGATHEENRSESDKDTRATEQSYLARGQAMRVEALTEELQRMGALILSNEPDKNVVGPDVLVRIELDGEDERIFYVVPFGGGTELRVGRTKLTVIAPNSPVGLALTGKAQGETCEVSMRGKTLEAEILELR